MPKYGARYLQWAPFAATNPEPDNAYPNYGAPKNLGGLVKVTDSPTYNDAKAYADNGLAARKAGFKEVSIDTEVSEVSNSVASSIFGSVIDSETGNLEIGDDDAPWGGLAFYHSSEDKAGNTTHKGIYYPKVQATMQGEEYETTGENISFKNDKVKFAGTRCNNGKWKVKSCEEFKTEAQARAWVDAMLNPKTYHAINITMNGDESGEGVSPIGTNYVANAGEIAITITGTATALYDNGTDKVASITDGVYTLANVTSPHDIVVIF